jgi:ParB family protein of integrating conjugative element (PFGI_1 class)
MAEITSQQMAGKLLAAGFERSGPSASTLSDPIADTPMVVTLDQLRPYDHDPRKKRNPAYEEIKASIRERGLDAAPAITRRPGEDHYIIRNGGNTRLAILRELWSETKDERFFRISCLFRPWPSRGEVVMLTGHLAENELRGGLTFIERALGVEKAREFYEQESGTTLSQSELARRLAADGFPVQQSHISRMNDAVQYLLPAIPTVLYGGLGRHQVERLSVMRKACMLAWERYAKGRTLVQDFDDFFQEVLSQFDVAGRRVRRAARAGRADRPDVRVARHRLRRAGAGPHRIRKPAARLGQRPNPALDAARVAGASAICAHAPANTAPATRGCIERRLQADLRQRLRRARRHGYERLPGPASPAAGVICCREHIVSPAPTTERLQSIQRMVADRAGRCAAPDFSASVLQSIPVQAGGLYPISDVWHIDRGPGHSPSACASTSRSSHARSRARQAWIECIEDRADGIGFACHASAQTPSHIAGPRRPRIAGVPGRPAASPTSACTSGKSSSSCRRCCTAKAMRPGA